MTLATQYPLVRQSLQQILDGQTTEGAYLACPSFTSYCYCWFRDGAFIAEAMDDWGYHDSASAFHTWVMRTLALQLPASSLVLAEHPLPPDRLLHTRYQPDGTPGDEEWPNFQLDGFGTWLWSYQRHLQRTSTAPDTQARRVVEQLARYLVALWPRPNYDCWEEHRDKVHPSTLGAIYAGLKGAANLLPDSAFDGAAQAVRSYLLTSGVSNGHFTKHIDSTDVDANLLWLITPYEVVEASHPIARATIAKVRADLLDADGGVHRYKRDTFYGGGSWILLTAALAQAHLAAGERQEVERLRRWIEAQATSEGHLPEQTAHYLNEREAVLEWEERWGKSACPLLWSHASYLSLLKRMERR